MVPITKITTINMINIFETLYSSGFWFYQLLDKLLWSEKLRDSVDRIAHDIEIHAFLPSIFLIECRNVTQAYMRCVPKFFFFVILDKDKPLPNTVDKFICTIAFINQIEQLHYEYQLRTVNHSIIMLLNLEKVITIFFGFRKYQRNNDSDTAQLR